MCVRGESKEERELIMKEWKQLDMLEYMKVHDI